MRSRPWLPPVVILAASGIYVAVPGGAAHLAFGLLAVAAAVLLAIAAEAGLRARRRGDRGIG